MYARSNVDKAVSKAFDFILPRFITTFIPHLDTYLHDPHCSRQWLQS